MRPNNEHTKTLSELLCDGRDIAGEFIHDFFYTGGRVWYGLTTLPLRVPTFIRKARTGSTLMHRALDKAEATPISQPIPFTLGNALGGLTGILGSLATIGTGIWYAAANSYEGNHDLTTTMTVTTTVTNTLSAVYELHRTRRRAHAIETC